MATWQEHVLPHGPLLTVGPRLWYVVGRLKRGTMTRNMVVHKLASGGLLIHSGIALDEATLADLVRHGQPEILIVPNRFHRMDAAVWKQRFPNLAVLAPRAAIAAVARVVAVDGACEDKLHTHGVIVHEPTGIKPFELCYELDSGAGQALVVTDILMNLENQPGFSGWFMRTIGSSGFFGITGIGRLLLLKDRVAFRAWLTQLAERTDVRAICVAHGTPITTDCTSALRAAAARLH